MLLLLLRNTDVFAKNGAASGQIYCAKTSVPPGVPSHRDSDANLPAGLRPPLRPYSRTPHISPHALIRPSRLTLVGAGVVLGDLVQVFAGRGGVIARDAGLAELVAVEADRPGDRRNRQIP